ncbi:ABC transporter ATP-binding protein [Albidovulum sp.]|uniref:ABC transporter ATP-binding protein n=1 Tax=Albidovulum sp. TaxID=1872424 RepID=UPI0039B8BD83
MTMRERAAALVVRGVLGRRAAPWLTPVMAQALPGIGLLLVTSLAAALLGLVPPWLTKLLIDRGLLAQDWGAVRHYVALAFLAGLVILLASVGNNLLHLHFSARMLTGLRARLLDAALHRRADRPPLTVGEALSRIDGDAAEIQRFAFDTSLAAAASVFRLIGGTAMLFVLDWRLALIPLVAAPVNLGFLAWARPRSRARADELRAARGEIATHLAEGFAGLPTLRALAAQGRRAEGFAPLQSRQVGLLMRQRRWAELVGFVPQVSGALVRSAILLGGGWLILRGDWQIGSLIAFLGYVGMMTGPMQNLLGLYHAQAVAQVALARLNDLAEPDADERGGRAPGPGPGAVRLVNARGLAASHPPVDLAIAPGSLVLLDGPSGAGKSTLAALLARMAPSAPGSQVFLDGENVAGLDPAALRRAVAIVPQAVALFRGTVAENLRLADPETTDERIREMLALVAAPVSPDTMIEEAGRNLSGGERQRIALARALLVPFRVLVLDECLSEVDGPTARAILASLRRRFADRTIIVIAHAGPARDLPFDQILSLSPQSPLRNTRGGTPHQREKARENAV